MHNIWELAEASTLPDMICIIGQMMIDVQYVPEIMYIVWNVVTITYKTSAAKLQI